MKIDRLLAMTILLLNRRKLTARELAEYFEVSVRTIYRDADTLNRAGIPVISFQGYEGGFCIPDNYKLSRQLLTFEDMLSLLTTLNGVNASLQNVDLDRAIEKITALIPADKEEAYRRHTDSFVIDIAPWGTTTHRQEVLTQVHKSVQDSSLLHFEYTGSQGKQSKRLVEPHTLVFKNYNWYLLAYCRLREAIRVFRLSRIRNIRVSPEHFVRRPVAPGYYFQPQNDSRPLVELILKFYAQARIRVEEIFDHQHLKYNDDGSITANISVPEDEWIISFILGFGDAVELLSPPAWRHSLNEKINTLQKIYSNLT